MPNNSQPHLRTINLSLSVGARQLVTNLNWQVNAGECWCIIGQNGAGKTTLLRSLSGLLNIPDPASEVVINNRPLDAWSLTDLAKIRSYLPQGHNDVFAYRVIESVLGARYPHIDGRFWDSPEDLEIAYAALAKLDVAELAERDVRSLSGGERQRVAIAALLVQDAQFMLLDEPTTALDLTHQVSALQLFAEQCKTQHKSVIMVSHDLNLAYRIATHALLLMNDGSWHAGLASETMTQHALSRCLGYPIKIIWHDEQCVFLPANFSNS